MTKSAEETPHSVAATGLSVLFLELSYAAGACGECLLPHHQDLARLHCGKKSAQHVPQPIDALLLGANSDIMVDATWTARLEILLPITHPIVPFRTPPAYSGLDNE